MGLHATSQTLVLPQVSYMRATMLQGDRGHKRSHMRKAGKSRWSHMLQYDTGNGVEESVRFLLMSLYDLEFGVEESTGPGLLHVQYGWIDGVEESVFDQGSAALHHPP